MEEYDHYKGIIADREKKLYLEVRYINKPFRISNLKIM